MIPAFAVSNTINCYITNKTNSIYAGLFSAVMWSTWIMTADQCNCIEKETAIQEKNKKTIPIFYIYLL